MKVVRYEGIPHFWEDEVPEEVRRKYPGVEDVLNWLEKERSDKECAMSLFYLVYDLVGKLHPATQIEKRIIGLEQELRGELWEEKRAARNAAGKVDIAKLDLAKFFVYMHVACSAIVVVQTKDETWMRTYNEIVNEIERLWDEGYDEVLGALDHENVFDKSVCRLLTDVGARLFNIRYEEGEWEKALLNLGMSIRASQIVGREFRLAEAALRAGRDKAGMAVADSFLKLWDSPGQVGHWPEVTEACKGIWDSEMFWEDEVVSEADLKRFLGSDWQMATNEGHSFWLLALGLCQCGQREKERVNNLSEERLKQYFFHACWENIAAADRGYLLDIDQRWYSLEEKINFGSILSNLKIVTENLLRVALWDPLIEWKPHSSSRNLQRDKREAALDKEIAFVKGKERDSGGNYHPALVNFIVMLQAPSFADFMQQELVDKRKVSRRDCDFVLSRETIKSLQTLNSVRRTQQHPGGPREWGRENVIPLLGKCFGIGCQGILPTLARMSRNN